MNELARIVVPPPDSATDADNAARGPGTAAVLDPYRSATLGRRYLAVLLVARLTMIACGTAVAALFAYELRVPFPFRQVAAVLLCVALLSFWAARRVRAGATISANEYALQLLADIAMLTYALASSGGRLNPFDTFYLVPCLLAAYALPRRHLAFVVGIGLAAWIYIHSYVGDLPPFPLSAEILAHAMLVGFAVYFAFSMAKVLRQHERRVARDREAALEQRNASAIRAVAAQAADSISTPLATIAVLLHELSEHKLTAHDERDALDTLEKQVGVCKENISRLLASVGHARGEAASAMSVADLLRRVCEECELTDPLVCTALDLSGAEPAPLIAVERSLFDALVLLAQDCAAEPPNSVTVAADWDASRLTIRMAGGGGRSWPVSQIQFGALAAPTLPGATSQSRESLTLAAMLIDRFGGTLTYRPGSDEKWVQVSLPLSRLIR